MEQSKQMRNSRERFDVGTLHSSAAVRVAAAADIPGNQPSAQNRNLPLVDGRFPALNSGKKEKKNTR